MPGRRPVMPRKRLQCRRGQNGIDAGAGASPAQRRRQYALCSSPTFAKAHAFGDLPWAEEGDEE